MYEGTESSDVLMLNLTRIDNPGKKEIFIIDWCVSLY